MEEIKLENKLVDSGQVNYFWRLVIESKGELGEISKNQKF